MREENIAKHAAKKVETVEITEHAPDFLNVCICDDEDEHIGQLKQILEELGDEIHMQIATDDCPHKLLQRLEEWARGGRELPDVIFLDIRMPGMDGVSFGKALRGIAPDIYVVFTTAYEEYAIEGYEAQAFRYLLKPLTGEMIRRVLRGIQADIGRKKKLRVRLSKEEKILSLHEILYLSAEDKYTILYTTDGYYVDRTSLTDYESLLLPYGFYRIHRKYIVNFYHHKSMGKGYVTLSNGMKLPISRRRAAAYYEELFNRLGKELL